MQGSSDKEWIFPAAQTDALIFNVGATQQLQVLGLVFANAGSVTADVSVRLGFATTTLPATSSTTGADGVFFSHGGIVKAGGGAVRAIPCVGPIGVPLRITNSVPTGGDLRLCMTYRLVETI